MSDNIIKITCKSCHANLALTGNTYRAKILSCQYCGTVMDSQHEFKALYSFTQIQQLNTPLRIGMQGKIQNVSFEITGYIVYKSRKNEWMDFQLYSPTHGYAQLIRKAGQYLFLRRTYYLPDMNLWQLRQGDQFSSKGIQFQITDFYFAEIFYAAGSLTQAVKQGKRNKQCFARRDDKCFLSIQKKELVEYYSGDEISSEKLEALFM